MSLDALLTIGMYNGFEEALSQLRNTIATSPEAISIPFPKYLTQLDCNSYLRVLWSYLVMEYGDYGTSPRFGWIYVKYRAEIVAAFTEQLEEP